MNFWYDNAVFYHIYTLGLCNASITNEYESVENKLIEINKWILHVKEMGCNAVYFGPVFKSKTHGYDTTDYYQIDNRIGDNEAFADMVRNFHSNGLRVVLDAVFNHCGRDFFAFKDVCVNGVSSKYNEWFSGLDFTKKSPLGDIFTYDTWNGYNELVKLNLKNPEVKEYIFNAVKFWIHNFNIDGLRLDCADCLDFEFMRDLRREAVMLKEDFWLMGEVVHGDYGKWANAEMLHSITNYEVYKGLYSSHNDKNLYEIAYSLNREFNSQAGIYKNLRLYNFADNHDQNRLASTVKNPAYMNTIYILLFTIPGIPSIYYGSEWGLKGVKANGSDLPIRPYIDLDTVKNLNCGITELIKKLSYIRNESDALNKGDYKQILITYERQFAFERTFGFERFIVVINASENNAYVNLFEHNDNNACFYDCLNNEQVNGSMNKLTVKPFWGRILKKC